MLTFEQIKELIDLVATHRLTGIELERSGFRCRIEGYKAGEVIFPPPGEPAAAPAVAAPAAAPADTPAAAAEAVADGLHVVTSPIVGTFYRAPNPETSPFVDVGSRVEQGQILCIVEAMKLMNEIEADTAGVVVEIHPENGQPVEFGERLFAIKAD